MPAKKVEYKFLTCGTMNVEEAINSAVAEGWTLFDAPRFAYFGEATGHPIFSITMLREKITFQGSLFDPKSELAKEFSDNGQ